MMKRITALLLALCILILFSGALASEITEEHFPGYYVELRSNTKDLSEMAKRADWRLVDAGSIDEAFFGVVYPSTGRSKDGFSYEGKKATFYIFITVPPKNKRTSSVTTITGTRFAIQYASRDEAETAINESLAWLEDRYGDSPVEKGKYLLMLNADPVEIHVYRLKNRPASISFDMNLAKDADQLLSAYGYQSLEDVPAAPWKPIGIAPQE